LGSSPSEKLAQPAHAIHARQSSRVWIPRTVDRPFRTFLRSRDPSRSKRDHPARDALSPALLDRGNARGVGRSAWKSPAEFVVRPVEDAARTPCGRCLRAGVPCGTVAIVPARTIVKDSARIGGKRPLAFERME
jgi:hypothetical protein